MSFRAVIDIRFAQATVIDARLSISLSVRHTFVTCVNTAERIESVFRMEVAVI